MKKLIKNYQVGKSKDIDIYNITIKDLLSEKDNIYKIDMYQRKYSWEENQVKDLLEDYMNAIESGNEHYLGVITLVPKEKNIFSVVDGQQRLITNMLLLCALRDVSYEIGEELLAKKIQKSYISSKSGARVEGCNLDCDLLHKLTNVFSVNKGEFIEDYINSKGIAEKLLLFVKSSINEKKISWNDKYFQIITKKKFKLIYNYSLILDEVRNIINSKNVSRNSKESIEMILEVLEKVTVISVVSKNNKNIFMLFNSLNNKGMMLSQFDVIRNIFFSSLSCRNIKQSTLEIFGNKWDELILILEDIDHIRFLKYYLMCEKVNVVSEDELSKEFKKIFDETCLDDVTSEKFMNSLIRYAEIYEALFRNYDRSDWGDSHYFIHLLGQEACYSLLMKCIYDKGEDKEFILNVFTKLEAFSLGRKVTKKSVKDLDFVFRELIEMYMNGKDLLEEIEQKKEKNIEEALKIREWRKDCLIKYIFQRKYGSRNIGTIGKINDDGEHLFKLGNYYSKSKENIEKISKENIEERSSSLYDEFINWTSK